ncbi:hypothetical protein [Brachyspira hyodysenteriae]|uniref:hypothetical protein n=3 Tax=Brachyspira hyodysenteriae TaxID=159 RepID=UPI0022CE2108|nr:hypothetical protein [Brachyspira hyodysenteriae]MCZ9890392.1 hypothetical protein [Brachyspira hyodysenteriae]
MQYSIVNFKKAIESSYSKRIDPEFFYPEYLINDNKIKKHNYSCLSNFIQVITGGATPLGAEYNDGVIPFLRVQNIMENYIDTSDVVYISKEDDNLLSRSRLKKYDVLLTITGAYGKSSVVLDEQVNSNINQHSVKMEIININPFYLSTFFNTRHGYMQSTKNIVGITRPALDYSSIRNFFIPIFSDEFQKSIEKLVLEAHNQRQKSNSLMKEANEILEKEIGFDKLEIKKKKVNYSIVNYRETLSSKRIDAEYYQEKYKIIMDKIQSYKNGCIKITDLNSINNKLISIDKNKKYEYIELSNIDSMGFINNLELYYGYELPSRARRLLNNNDVIISSVEGSLDKSSLIYNNNDNLLCSTGFLVFNENEFINPETLFCFFRLALIKELLKKISKGTILTAFDSNAICDMEIPNLDKNVQNVIAEKVQDAYKARDKAKALLEEAKKKVEDAIENGE